MTAYLVIREGSKWTDVFRLVDGESITVGRAPTNAIVVKDERCSRNHAEVFQSQGQWMLRDLDSRNGTLVDGQRIQHDYHLQPGEIIRIGNSHLAFVHDLSQAFPDSHSVLRTAQAVDQEMSGELTMGPPDNESVLETYEPTTITHRRGQSRFLEPPEEEDVDVSLPKVGRAAANLCRLAFELAKATDVVTLANVALDGLFEGTQVDAGAVLLQARRPSPKQHADKLEVVASRSDSPHRYHRVSQFLSTTVMREGQAVLARNVMDDSQLGSRDSKGDILATSVICAPIRRDGKVLGVIHLYSTDAGKPTDPDDLEFTLAVADTVAVALENLSRQQELAENLNQIRDENVELRERLGVQSEIVGASEAMNQVAREIARAAPSRATVLIRGESGVGKELVARAVHFSSPRRKAPFGCINCAALSETLLESELFGHEKGAFTGATERKIGKFEAADKGTLMLDEIGEMSPKTQAKFLRVLEGHPFERVGGSEAIKVDVRVIAATNRDLGEFVREGRFREDLYYRLSVFELYIPPLRDRGGDIELLVNHFLEHFKRQHGRPGLGLAPESRTKLLAYAWPGNVRQLRNVIDSAVVMSESNFILPEDLGLRDAGTSDQLESLQLEFWEKKLIHEALKRTSGSIPEAAKLLGVGRATLYRKVEEYGIERK
jgi:transcriptional regulator with GAF, ATPase, and Fis domain